MTDHRAEAEALLAATVNPELVVRAARALRHNDPTDYERRSASDAEYELLASAVADDIRAEALADLAAAHEAETVIRAAVAHVTGETL